MEDDTTDLFFDAALQGKMPADTRPQVLKAIVPSAVACDFGLTTPDHERALIACVQAGEITRDALRGACCDGVALTRLVRGCKANPTPGIIYESMWDLFAPDEGDTVQVRTRVDNPDGVPAALEGARAAVLGFSVAPKTFMVHVTFAPDGVWVEERWITTGTFDVRDLKRLQEDK